MSDTESKQDTTKNDVSVAETNVKENKNTEITNMNSSNAHNTYAQLICREDPKNKKGMLYSNQEMKDFSQLRRARKGEPPMTTPLQSIIPEKKYFQLKKI